MQFAFVPTVREWWDKATSDDVSIFDFPPNKNPEIRNLKKGDICFAVLYDEDVIVGQFKVKEVRKISGREYHKLKNKIAIIKRVPIPKNEDFVWIIEFEKLTEFGNPLPFTIIRELYRRVTGKSLGPFGSVAKTFNMDREVYAILFSIIKFHASSEVEYLEYRIEKGKRRLLISLTL